jgi:hypothetical protein
MALATDRCRTDLEGRKRGEVLGSRPLGTIEFMHHPLHNFMKKRPFRFLATTKGQCIVIMVAVLSITLGYFG